VKRKKPTALRERLAFFFERGECCEEFKQQMIATFAIEILRASSQDALRMTRLNFLEVR
jgi:hypothetical protein